MRKYKNLSKPKMAEKEKELAAAILEITAELETMQVAMYVCMYALHCVYMYVCMYV